MQSRTSRGTFNIAAAVPGTGEKSAAYSASLIVSDFQIVERELEGPIEVELAAIGQEIVVDAEAQIPRQSRKIHNEPGREETIIAASVGRSCSAVVVAGRPCTWCPEAQLAKNLW